MTKTLDALFAVACHPRRRTGVGASTQAPAWSDWNDSPDFETPRHAMARRKADAAHWLAVFSR